MTCRVLGGERGAGAVHRGWGGGVSWRQVLSLRFSLFWFGVHGLVSLSYGAVSVSSIGDNEDHISSNNNIFVIIIIILVFVIMMLLW